MRSILSEYFKCCIICLQLIDKISDDRIKAFKSSMSELTSEMSQPALKL
jgi:hypothetical protein